MKRQILGGALAVLALAASACGTNGGTRQTSAGAPASATTLDLHTITTRGMGKVKTIPDIATITIGVTTRRSAATDALSQNNSETAALTSKLKSGGVAEKDIQTANLGINPSYDNNGHPNGYEVTNTVTATLRNLKKAGEIIDSAARAVGDDVRLQGIQFGIGDDTTARANARADAVRQARAQADQIAKAANVSVGSVRTITETSESAPSPFYSRAGVMDAAAMPISPGQVEVGVSVDVTYDIG